MTPEEVRQRDLRIEQMTEYYTRWAKPEITAKDLAHAHELGYQCGVMAQQREMRRLIGIPNWHL